MIYAVVDGAQVVERRQILDWNNYEQLRKDARDERGDGGPTIRPIVYEGEGSSETEVLEKTRLRVIRSNPQITANEVREECQRRIFQLLGVSDMDACVIKQLNALMRGTELVNKKALGQSLTDAEKAEEAALTAVAERIKKLRACSNVLEPKPPADYRAEKYWV